MGVDEDRDVDVEVALKVFRRCIHGVVRVRVFPDRHG